MLSIQLYIPDNDERSKVLRRVLVRRALLMLTLLLRSISRAVRRRFPTLQDLVKNGWDHTMFYLNSMSPIILHLFKIFYLKAS